MPDVLTIPQSIERARADGLPVTEYALRAWVKSGAVPVRMIGRKALIFYPKLREFLTCAEGGDITPQMVSNARDYGTIRRIG